MSETGAWTHARTRGLGAEAVRKGEWVVDCHRSCSSDSCEFVTVKGGGGRGFARG